MTDKPKLPSDKPENLLMSNSKPNISASATRDQDGHIVLDLTGTTDEGVGNDMVLSKLNASAPSVTFAPVPGQPGKFKTITPSALTSLNLSVAGLNEGLADYTTVKKIEVPLSPEAEVVMVTRKVVGTCSEGENDFPTCSPDITPPNAPVISGLAIDTSTADLPPVSGDAGSYPVNFAVGDSKSDATTSSVKEQDGFITVDVPGAEDKK
ncbi:MAG: hypothetical protein V1880_04530 [Patescibacteria group bacterium]